MTIHQCPKCELRFDHRTELDAHCREDHPAFRHEYPAAPHVMTSAEEPMVRPSPHTVEPHQHENASVFLRWMAPRRRSDHRAV